MEILLETTTERYSLTLSVSLDAYKLFLSLLPLVQTPAITRIEIINLIKTQAAEDLMDLAVIDDIIEQCNQGKSAKERRIAKGAEPEVGRDGRIVLMARKYTGERKENYTAENSSQLKELHLFDNIEQGQIVARIYPPMQGKSGVTVFGKEVPGKLGKEYKAVFDKSLLFEEDSTNKSCYKTLRAQKSGCLIEKDGCLSIIDELIIKTNIDYHTGNINFIGKVRVQGDVMPGFKVRAKQGITILGTLQDGSLECELGDVEIKGGAFGGDFGRVNCGGTLTVKHTNNLFAEVGGFIKIQKEARDSELRCLQSLLMPNGQLIGGKCFLVNGGEINIVGNDSGILTQINLANNVVASSDYESICQNLDKHEEIIKVIKTHLGPLADKPWRLDFLNPIHRQRMQGFLDKLNSVIKSRDSLLDKRKKLLEKVTSESMAQLNVLTMTYPGVQIKYAEKELTLKDAVKGPISFIVQMDTQELITSELTKLKNVEKNKDSKKNAKQ